MKQPVNAIENFYASVNGAKKIKENTIINSFQALARRLFPKGDGVKTSTVPVWLEKKGFCISEFIRVGRQCLYLDYGSYGGVQVRLVNI